MRRTEGVDSKTEEELDGGGGRRREGVIKPTGGRMGGWRQGAWEWEEVAAGVVGGRDGVDGAWIGKNAP
jgi:hypothetical protein